MIASMARGVRHWVAVLAACIPFALPAAGPSGAQERAAQQFLAAVAQGNPQAVAAALHPGELKRLRAAITERLRADAGRGDPGSRTRLFGEAMMLDDIERMTDLAFFATIGQRLRYPARVFESVDGLAAIPGDNKLVYVVIRGRQPDGRGETRVVALVPVLPDGKDWKAAVPSEIEAQIEDLLDGFPPSAGLVPRFQDAAAPSTAPPAQNSPEILEMLEQAGAALIDGRCGDYYAEYLSPNFRRVTSKSALQALVKSCERSDALRETLVATLEIVSGLPPRYDLGGNRATYDTAGRGLPFDRFVLERIDKRWYIAE
jgi:hypothetical protein